VCSDDHDLTVSQRLVERDLRVVDAGFQVVGPTDQVLVSDLFVRRDGVGSDEAVVFERHSHVADDRRPVTARTLVLLEPDGGLRRLPGRQERA